jgi:hypothetical protein
VGARYHPGVIWGPFLLALALGLVVSAGLYFAYLWPQVEPDEPDAEAKTADPPAETAASEPAATGEIASESTSA